jgi:hypothetical protein
MKRPSFQFYPSDWLRDTALRSCSTEARGLWIDMICYMHEGTPYGYLKVNNKVILADNLSRMVGLTLEKVNGCLEELHEAGVYDIANDGSIFSKRMVRDEYLRNIRSEGGKLGGNPNLKNMGKVNLVDNLKIENKDKPIPTPTSSSSSSSSNKYSYEFESFWKEYPRHENKIGAMKSWKKVDVELDVILKAVEKHKQTKQWKDGIYPHASTWLNQRRWEDEMVIETQDRVSFI